MDAAYYGDALLLVTGAVGKFDAYGAVADLTTPEPIWSALIDPAHRRQRSR
jgi:hypothetical protein